MTTGAIYLITRDLVLRKCDTGIFLYRNCQKARRGRLLPADVQKDVPRRPGGACSIR